MPAGILGARVSRLEPEGIRDPFDAVALADADDVETARGRVVKLLQIMGGCPGDARLFCAGDGFSRGAVGAGTAESDLDKCQDIAVLHDQVDLAEAAAVVLLHQPQTLCLKELARELLLGLANLGATISGARRRHQDSPRCRVGRVCPLAPPPEVPNPTSAPRGGGG